MYAAATFIKYNNKIYIRYQCTSLSRDLKNVTNTQTYKEIFYSCVSETESIYNIYICLGICWITYFVHRVFYILFSYLLFVCIEEMLFFSYRTSTMIMGLLVFIMCTARYSLDYFMVLKKKKEKTHLMGF